MKSKQIIKSTISVSIITMVSRVLGYIRDAVSAALLGVGMVSDAFFVAFRIPNLLRNLLAEGALSSAFIPVFTEYLEKKKKADIWNLAANVLTLLTVVLIIITAAGIFFAKYIVKIIAPGFSNDPVKFSLTVELTKYLFPFILFVSIAALFLGILNSLKKFSIPAFAPVVLNISMICAGLFLCPALGSTPEKQVWGWVIGALFGAFLEIVIQLLPSIKSGFKLKFFIDLKEKGLQKIIKLMIPATIGQSVTQINLLINTILASLLLEGSVTYLYYGNRLMQLPFGVFGVAIATVSFTYISQYAARKDFAGLGEIIHSSLKQAFFIVIPASAGLIFLSLPINALLFHYGRFEYADAVNTAKASIMYCIGIFAFTGIKILTQVFYSIDRSATAVKISVFSMILNVILCILLMFPLKYLGLALAASIAGIIQFFVLYYYIRKYIGNLKTIDLIIFSIKVIIISIIMGVFVLLFSNFLSGQFNTIYSRMINAIIVLLSIILGLLIYFIFLKIFKIQEINFIYNIFLKKFKKYWLKSIK